jgi:hypothetical protein
MWSRAVKAVPTNWPVSFWFMAHVSAKILDSAQISSIATSEAFPFGGAAAAALDASLA